MNGHHMCVRSAGGQHAREMGGRGDHRNRTGAIEHRIKATLLMFCRHVCHVILKLLEAASNLTWERAIVKDLRQ